MKRVIVKANRSDSPTTFFDSVILQCGAVSCSASRSSQNFKGSNVNMTQSDMLTILRHYRGAYSVCLDKLKNIVSNELFNTLNGGKL